MSAKDQTRGKPIITHYFAPQQLSPGDVWQIYLKASDEDGDMKYILAEVYHAGTGDYPLCFINIPADQRRNLSGYIYLPTAGMDSLDFLNLSLKVTIQGKKGQHSEPLSFNLTFDSRAKRENPPAGIFQDRELGPIMVKLTPGGVTPGP